MLVPESWLRAYCNPPLDAEAIAHALTMAGLEVEEVHRAVPAFEKVVVAAILTREKHPDADRLSVCQVDVGQGQPLTIVCGAPNARPGLRVPCALEGAVLPPGADGRSLRIKRARMRGVESEGMLCSARELGLSEDAAGLLELPTDAPIGIDLREYLALDEAIFEIKLTPNRADALSVYGVARELSAITGAPLAPQPQRSVTTRHQQRLSARVLAPDLCGRFAGRIIRDVNARAATPSWMKTRLERAGQRSISALVDISNYVMLELGRPSHVFDLDRVQGDLEVRWAKAGETLVLLNGQTVELDPSIGVIAAGGKVESLAGIMGGEATAVSLDTRNVYLEAAFWHPQAIQGRARRFGFSTEAGHRFERGVDWQTIPEHLDYLTALILDICGGEAGPVDLQTLNLPERKSVNMRVARARKIIGLDLSGDRISEIFDRLGLAHVREGQGEQETITVTPPSYRFDLAIEEDLIEEVARIHGFEAIPAQPPLARASMRVAPEGQLSLHALRDRMVEADYIEVINYAFVEPAWERDLLGQDHPIRLLNPIASHMAVMRSSLLPGLLANIRHNLSHRADRVRVFELGKVFHRDPQLRDGPLTVAGVAQPLRLAGAAWGPALPEQWGEPSRAVDFYDVKADLAPLLPRGVSFQPGGHPLLHPGRCARIMLGEVELGVIGELHPRHWATFELPSAAVLFELDAERLRSIGLPELHPISRQPIVRRDLALVVDQSVEAGRILGVLRNAASPIVQDMQVFDVYRGTPLESNEKSIAIRILMQDSERTLSDSEIDEACQLLVKLAEQEFAARLRR